MNESTNKFEKPFISEREVIIILDTEDFGSPEAREILREYIDQCHSEADAEFAENPDNAGISNRVNIKTAIKIADLYSKVGKYKDLARDEYEEVLMVASQSEVTEDLAQDIEAKISSLGM